LVNLFFFRKKFILKISMLMLYYHIQSNLFIITPLGKQKCVIIKRCDYIDLPPYNHMLLMCEYTEVNN